LHLMRAQFCPFLQGSADQRRLGGGWHR
jgi:hypothetical protein